MSSPLDDLTSRPDVPASEEAIPEPPISLEDGVVDRYLVGALRPDEAERAKRFFSDPQRAHVLARVKEWAERDVDAQAPHAAQTLEELWGQICDREALDRGAAKTVGQNLQSHSELRRFENVFEKQKIHTPRQSGRIFPGQALRVGVWTGALSAAIVGLALFAHRGQETRANVAHVYATQASQQAIVNLGDGTRLTLAPQTMVRVFPFGAQRRTVVLERGEAYFNVAHASGAPFVVQSGRVTAQVLGTTFLVRRASGSEHVHVAVMDGKVRVTPLAGAQTGVTLTQGQVGEVTDSITQVNTVDEVSPGTEWTPGLIIFRHTPLSKVLQTVSQWYGYQFRYADPTLGTRNVTIGISTRSSAEALAVIEQLLSVNLTVVGDTVTLVPHAALSDRHAPRIRTYDVWSPSREVGR